MNNNQYIENIKLLKENTNRSINYHEKTIIDVLGSTLIPHFLKERHSSEVALK